MIARIKTAKVIVSELLGDDIFFGFDTIDSVVIDDIATPTATYIPGG